MSFGVLISLGIYQSNLLHSFIDMMAQYAIGFISFIIYNLLKEYNVFDTTLWYNAKCKTEL